MRHVIQRVSIWRRVHLMFWMLLLLQAAAFGQRHLAKVPEIDGSAARSAVTVLFLGVALLVRQRVPADCADGARD